jgi:hypothetical protein
VRAKGTVFRVGKREEGLEVWKRVNRGKGISFLQIHDRLFN